MQNSRMINDNPHLTNVVKIPSIKEHPFKIHDFHVHPDEDIGSYLRKFHIGSLNLMPSWKIKSIIDFQSKVPNDFSGPNIYYDKLNSTVKDLRNSKWSGKIFLFAPMVLATTFMTLNKFHLNSLRDFKDFKFAGVKFHPLQQFPITRDFLDPLMKIIKDQGLLVYIHTDWIPSTEFGKVKGLMPETFNKIVSWYPEIQFIMGHSGNNDSYLSIWKIIKKYPNVTAETSMAPAPQELEKIIKHCGVKRLLFGSNYPFASPNVEIMKILRLYKVSDEEKQQIFFDNASDLMKDRPYNEI